MIDVFKFIRLNTNLCIYVYLKQNIIVELYIDDIIVAVKFLKIF